MIRTISLPTLLCLVAIAFCCAFDSSVTLAAQRSRKASVRRSKVRRAEAAAAAEAPNEDAKKREEIDKAISEACKDLEATIGRASRANAQFPYDELTLGANFKANCEADGTISWTATRKYSPGYGVQTAYNWTVALKVTDLELARLDSQHGVVKFVSGDGEILLNGTLDGANKFGNLSEARLDLRHEEHAEELKKLVRSLAGSLTEKGKLPAIAQQVPRDNTPE